MSVLPAQPGRDAGVERICSARLPTRFGEFRLEGYRSLVSGEELVALWTGELSADAPTLARIQSQCLTGEVFGSLRCDCAAQLEGALRLVQAEGRGAVVYQFQEGRGIGIMNKIRAYALQDGGADTVQANERLGFAPDLRVFWQCAEVLADLGLRRVRLITNNPQKLDAVRRAGLEAERVAVPFEPPAPARRYLETKQRKLGHLPPAGAPVRDDLDRPLRELFRSRRSCSAFASRDVAPELLEIALGAASHAPSSFNEQPWRFVVARREHDPEAFAELLGCLSPHNAVWARTAPVLFLSLARRSFAASGKLNRHALHDVGLAMANVTLQATALGLAVHQMGGFDARRARARLSIPTDFTPVCVVAVGHPDEDGEPPRGERRALEDYVFWGGWGGGLPKAGRDDA